MGQRKGPLKKWLVEGHAILEGAEGQDDFTWSGTGREEYQARGRDVPGGMVRAMGG